MNRYNRYHIEQLSIGDKIKGDKITFKTLKDLQDAYKSIDDGCDIYVILEDEITMLPNRMLNTKIYEGSITLTAKNKEEEK